VAGSVTLKDIAREARVSIGTVSRVFNNHLNVTDEVRQRVLQAATQLGYFSTSGSDARFYENTRTVKEVGFLFNYVSTDGIVANPFWSHILHGVEKEASKLNIKITYRSISSIQHTPDALLTTLYEMKLGGVLLVGPAEPDAIQAIQKTRLPLVLVDNYQHGCNAVLGDNFGGAKRAVEYLISMGHRQIAFISGPVLAGPRLVNKIYTIERRAEGYRMALMDAGLPISYELHEPAELHAEDGYNACQRLLARNKPFTAIFCANDAIAVGAMKALREAGLRIPEDVSLIGFDDIDMVEHLSPALTTIRVAKEVMGAVAIKRLLAQMNDPDPVGVSSVVDVELIIRDSVKQLTDS
jgi:DNA-binding LacI/PurR family transcriptional regulator